MSLLFPVMVISVLRREPALGSRAQDTNAVSAALAGHLLQDRQDGVGDNPHPMPTTISRPKIETPDSLKSIKGRVSVFVKVEVDSTGTPVHCRVIKSSDKRFNSAARHYAMEYRFDVKKTLVDMNWKSVWFSLRIVFNEQ